MEIIGGVVAFIKAIPIIDSWFQKLAAAYVAAQIASMKDADRAAIRKAISEFDQREIEKQLGSSTAGKPTGLGEIRDKLPGVP